MTIVEGDLTYKTSLIATCQGVATVITTTTTGASQIPTDSIPKIDQIGQLQLVEAAMESCVLKFIYQDFRLKCTDWRIA